MEEVHDMLTINHHVDPKLAGTRSLMVEILETSPYYLIDKHEIPETSLCCLIISQPENCAQDNQAPATLPIALSLKHFPKSHWGV